MRTMFIITQLAFLEQCYCQCKTNCTTNKQTYKKHKRLGTRLLKLTSQFGSATDSLYLALFWYLEGKFKNSLELLQKNRERLCQEYVFYCNEIKNKQAYTGKMQGKLMSIKIKEAMAFDIQILLHTVFCELDIELDLLKKPRLRECLIISFVFMEFLVFLCHYRLKSPCADQSLQRLNSLVCRDSGRYIVRYTRDIAWDIVGICHHLLGNLEQAIFAYRLSLEEINFNCINDAVKKRLALLGLVV